MRGSILRQHLLVLMCLEQEPPDDLLTGHIYISITEHYTLRLELLLITSPHITTELGTWQPLRKLGQHISLI